MSTGSAPSSAPRIVPVRGADRRTVLARALRIRQEGAVPLIGDERWSERHWNRLTTALAAFSASRSEIVARTGWAAFTSGSSGSPRVVLRTAESWECFFPEIDRWLRPGPDDVLLLPAHHVASLTAHGLAWASARCVDWAVPAGQRLRAEDLAEPGARSVAERGKDAAAPRQAAPTLVHGTPSHLQEILDLLDTGAPHRLRTVLVGGDRVPASVRRRAAEHGLRVIAYYGAAELSFVAADHGDGLRAVPGVRCRTERGQLLVRTQQAALGVLAVSDAPGAEPFSWTPLTGHGAERDLHGVGDLADIDASGRILLRGRADDAVLTAGATVVPADVEAVLAEHPGTAACLVRGEPRPRVGALVAAVVEPRPGALAQGTGPFLAELRRWAEDRLAPAQRPRRWRLVRRLPRTATGKVRRLDTAGLRELTEIRPDELATRPTAPARTRAHADLPTAGGPA